MAEPPVTASHSKVEPQAEIAIPLGQESEVSTASVTAEGITNEADTPNPVALEVDTPEESERTRATVEPHVHFENIFCRNGTNFYILLTVAVIAGALITGAIIEDVLRHPTTTNNKKNTTNTNNNNNNNNTTRDEIRESTIEILAPLSGTEIFRENNLRKESSRDRIAALEWLVDTHNFETLAHWKIRQRYVLALLYASTTGEGWFNSHNFLSPHRDECDWTMAEKPLDAKGVLCNKGGNVSQLLLGWNNLVGTLPPELSLFADSLEVLDVAGGSISGTIPSSFGSLTNLKEMRLNDNCFRGIIPAFLGNSKNHESVREETLPKIKLLALHNNQALEGSLNGFCNGTSRIGGVLHLSGDCGCPKANNKTGGAARIDCNCCQCCDQETMHPSPDFFNSVLTPNGYAKSSD